MLTLELLKSEPWIARERKREILIERSREEAIENEKEIKRRSTREGEREIK